MDENALLIEWRRLQEIDARLDRHRRRAKGLFGFLVGSDLDIRNERVAQYEAIQRVISDRPRLLLDLLKSGVLSHDEKRSLFVMANDGSTAKRDNVRFWHVYELLRQHQGDLPASIARTLDWQLRVCGW